MGGSEETLKLGRRGTTWGLLLAGAGGNRHLRLRREGAYVVGRSSACDVCLDDAGVSRRHVMLGVTPEAVEVQDLGSSNGTFIGERRLAPQERATLKPGDSCRVGNSVLLLFQYHDYESDSELPPAGEGEPVLVSAAMRRIVTSVEQLARGDLGVLLLGETGVGKEVLARLLHARSPRAAGPFVAVNCAALPEALMESELFGHERGAFTSADRPRQGRLEAAGGGTLLLDEVGDLPLTLQAKLLRVLEDKSVQPVGGSPRPIDLRFVAATNRDLERAAARGEFRRDLYYRLAGAVLRVPPLRERIEDIEPLARRFASETGRRMALGKSVEWSPVAIARLRSHPWRGNVRELRNVTERAMLMRAGERIEVEDLQLDEVGSETAELPVVDLSTDKMPPASDYGVATSRPPEDSQSHPPSGRPEEPQLRGALRDLERELIVSALEACGGNQTRAAAMLGISRRALVKKLGTHQVPRPRKR